jgi:hypothetical protein
MRRRFFWLLALAGVAWLYLRRGARRPQPVDRVPPAADPAEELRRKLDETQGREPQTSYPAKPEPEPADVLGVEQPRAEPAEPTADSLPTEPLPPVVSEDLDARRREIHEQARSAADEMRRTSSD